MLRVACVPRAGIAGRRRDLLAVSISRSAGWRPFASDFRSIFDYASNYEIICSATADDFIAPSVSRAIQQPAVSGAFIGDDS